MAVLLASAGVAHAHGSGADRGLVMLLPTTYYLAGGAFAVLASFLVLAKVPREDIEQTVAARWELFRVRDGLLETLRLWFSAATFVCWGLLVLAGLIGSRDPLANPLPTMFWSIWWVAFALLHVAFGNLWSWLNPWHAPIRLIGLISGRRHAHARLVPLPAMLRYWPSIVIFFGFAWFELVSLAPSDPTQLAKIIIAYWCFVFCAMLLFGEEAWATAAEPFSVFFAMIAALAPFQLETPQDGGNARVVTIGWPGRALLSKPPLPLSGTLFVLLALASVSFDGLSRTFFWLNLIGINPLEFPGRSAVVMPNTLGLIGTFLALAAVFLICVHIGCVLTGTKTSSIQAAGALVYSIIPISIGFHAAHYLTTLMLDGQFAVVSLSDPYAQGWDLLRVGAFQPTASFFNNIRDVTLIWNTQAVIICFAHVVGIIMAHSTAARLFGTRRRATTSQYALAGLMVFYTVFGLWLLSTPTGA
ncbi:MAG: hypothetical protein U1E61_02705 [Bradyrhizobium sp.]